MKEEREDTKVKEEVRKGVQVKGEDLMSKTIFVSELFNLKTMTFHNLCYLP